MGRARGWVFVVSLYTEGGHRIRGDALAGSVSLSTLLDPQTSAHLCSQ